MWDVIMSGILANSEDLRRRAGGADGEAARRVMVESGLDVWEGLGGRGRCGQFVQTPAVSARSHAPWLCVVGIRVVHWLSVVVLHTLPGSHERSMGGWMLQADLLEGWKLRGSSPLPTVERGLTAALVRRTSTIVLMRGPCHAG